MLNHARHHPLLLVGCFLGPLFREFEFTPDSTLLIDYRLKAIKIFIVLVLMLIEATSFPITNHEEYENSDEQHPILLLFEFSSNSKIFGQNFLLKKIEDLQDGKVSKRSQFPSQSLYWYFN